MKVPCGGFKIDNDTLKLKSDGTLYAAGGGGGSIPKPLTYDYMPEGYPKKSGWSIEWDGNADGLTSIEVQGSIFYKFSDLVLTDDDLANMTLVVYDSNGEPHDVSNITVTPVTDDFTMVTASGFVFTVVTAKKDNATANGITIPEKGVYVFSGSEPFRMSKEYITTMSTDFIQIVSETEPGLSIPLNDLLLKVREDIFSTYLRASRLEISKYTSSTSSVVQNAAERNNPKGIYSPNKFDGSVLSCKSYPYDYYLKVVISGEDSVEGWKISRDSPYMEKLWSISEDGVILSSSTKNSTKKFKITVDDSGTISATEVTS